MEPKQLVHEGEAVYRTVNSYIHGFQQCCSAAILHGVQANFTFAHYPAQATPGDDTPVKSFEEWQERRSSSASYPYFGLPYDYAMCAVLEKLYNKAKFGKGGRNMYASQSYSTQTWFIADRRRREGSISCMNFMLWLKEQGVSKVGRIHISPYRPGAHGGECKGGVYAPDLPKVEKFLDEKLADLNAHAEWVFKVKYKDAPVQEITEPTDEVGKLW